MSARRADLSRTSSLASVDSSDDGTAILSDSKRTRKRFSDWQLTMLEQLFHRTSHPSRDEREALACDMRMESKSVTIWFQNRRQSERKAGLHTSATHASSSPLTACTPSTTKTPSLLRRRSIAATSFSSPYAPSTPSRRPRVKLDDMATRSELRTAPPRTPARRPDPSKSLWDNMPSSPLAPPSPPPREYVELASARGRRGRTLEWACAAARVVGKERGPEGDETEDEDDGAHEAITPMGSLDSGDPFWDGKGRAKVGGLFGPQNKSKGKEKENVADDDVMSAALVLCGLGRRS